MRFAKIVFTIAGLWGLAILTPMYFLLDYVGRQYPPAVTHPDVYYGFVTVALAWQIAFLIIGRDPVRFRPLMPAAMMEKFGYVAMLAIVYARGGMQLAQFAVPFVPDFVLGLFFVAAFWKTSERGAILASATPTSNPLQRGIH